MTRFVRASLLVVVAASCLATPAFAEANIAIEVFDDPGFGFNDPTPVEPVGGNKRTTLGEQRLVAFQRAAEIWAEVLDSTVEIRILTSWEDTDAILGAASAGAWVRGSLGALRSNVWYPVALANRFSGTDLCPVLEECVVDHDMTVRFGARLPFYLGLDGNAGDQFDLVTVSLHEIAHGLGFSSNGSDEHRRADSGTFPAIFYDSIYHVFLEGGSLTGGSIDLTFPQMTRAQRSAAAGSVKYLHWVGPRASRIGAGLEDGYDEEHGHVLLDASSTESSLFHLNVRITPSNFMKPRIEEPAHDTTLAYSLLADMGWESTCPGDCNADGRVTVNELVRAVRMALGQESLVRCAILNTDNQGQVRVRELIRAVNSSLEGCAVEDSREPLERPLVRVEQASQARIQALSVLVQDERTRERRLSGPAGGIVSPGSGIAYGLAPVVAADGKAAAHCVALEPGLLP